MQARFFDAQSLVRLHVIADSDEREAQRVKLCVVGAIRKKAARIAGGAENAREAFARLTEKKDVLRRAAKREARRQHFTGTVAVQTGTFPFPDKTYGDTFVPAGDYQAVRVLLGEASGQNWWCVIYPALCAVEEVCAQALTSQEAVQFYSSIGRFLTNVFGGGAS